MESDDFRNYAIELVCRVFNVDRNRLMNGCRNEDVVDARCALVHILDLQGVTKTTIEKWTGLNPNSQAYLLRGFDERAKRPWYRHLIVAMIKDAKENCPIAFKAHNRDGELVLYMSKFE